MFGSVCFAAKIMGRNATFNRIVAGFSSFPPPSSPLSPSPNPRKPGTKAVTDINKDFFFKEIVYCTIILYGCIGTSDELYRNINIT